MAEKLFSAVILVSVICVLSGCEEPRVTEGLHIPQPYRLVMIDGDNQVGVVGTKAASSITVKVVSEDNKPVKKIKVSFTVSRGMGHFVDTIVVTDKEGIARGIFYFGSKRGDYTVMATVPGLFDSPQIFTLNSLRDVASTLTFLNGNNRTGIVNRKVTDITFLATDQYGNVADSVSITPIVIAGGGHTDSTSVTTDLEGFGRVHWYFGTTAGIQQLKLEGRSEDGTLFSAMVYGTANPDLPESLFVISGNNQTGLRGSKIPDNYILSVKDKFGNPNRQYAQVTFLTTIGNGFADDYSLLPNGLSQIVSSFTLASDTDYNALKATLLVGTIRPAEKKNSVYLTFRGLLPIVLDSLSLSGTLVKIDWSLTKNPDFASYKVFRKSSPNVTLLDQSIATVTNQAVTTTLDGSVVSGTTYYYRIFLELTDGYILPGNEMSIAIP